MAKNQYLPFATSDNANVLTSEEYNNLSARGNGFQSGVASSTQVNTPIRQATVIASAVAQYIADTSNTNMLDDGNVSSVVSALKNTINSSSSDKLPLTGGTVTGDLTARTITAYNYSKLYRIAVNQNNTISHFITGSTGEATRLRWNATNDTWNFENCSVTIDGDSVLTTSGGTVIGDTNFTGKLQQAGNDVITADNIVNYQNGIGIDQTWQDVTSERKNNTVYQNSTGKAIVVSIWQSSRPSDNNVNILVDDIKITHMDPSVGGCSATAIIPNGSSYKTTGWTSFSWNSRWLELR